MSVSNVESECRSYRYIGDRLKEMGWKVKSPARGGQIYTQNENARQNDKIKQAFGKERQGCIVDIGDGQYWVIEAKASPKEASQQAKEQAKKINRINGIHCQIITGFSRTPDTTHCIKTCCLVSGEWKSLKINSRQSTGFISPAQVKNVIQGGKGCLDEYEIADTLFSSKLAQINDILHNGAIHKRSRAEVLACLLLALANDPNMILSDDPTILIKDINNRAESELKKHSKGAFFNKIAIDKPQTDNHIKAKQALIRSIEILRDLNIASTINSGRDVLGQCYEQFLKYANDAKEIGIVLTPHHITNLAAEIIGVQSNDIVFDPTCGTGGFLVAALDKVRRDNGDIDSFKKGNLHGIEQDSLIATLAIVNMVFRGDGNSNITEGDCLKADIRKKFNKVLMNPPFALEREYEWQFVDKAMNHMHKAGLLFAVLPTTTMSASQDGRGEITWRENLLKKHTLVAVIKLAEGLFTPHVSKGTYGVVIRAHCPHKREKEVIWAVLHDGMVRTKTQSRWNNYSNTKLITKALKDYIFDETKPQYVPEELDCSSIQAVSDLSPENHIGTKSKEGRFDIPDVLRNTEEAKRFLKRKSLAIAHKNCKIFSVSCFFESLERGESGRKKDMEGGEIPLISTSEANNGISAMVKKEQCQMIYKAGKITISANGSSCRAHYHDYDFAANSDVFVASLKKSFSQRYFVLFLCAAINSEEWRYNYYRKLTKRKIDRLEVRVPMKKGKIDTQIIKKWGASV